MHPVSGYELQTLDDLSVNLQGGEADATPITFVDTKWQTEILSKNFKKKA